MDTSSLRRQRYSISKNRSFLSAKYYLKTISHLYVNLSAKCYSRSFVKLLRTKQFDLMHLNAIKMQPQDKFQFDFELRIGSYCVKLNAFLFCYCLAYTLKGKKLHSSISRRLINNSQILCDCATQEWGEGEIKSIEQQRKWKNKDKIQWRRESEKQIQI